MLRTVASSVLLLCSILPLSAAESLPDDRVTTNELIYFVLQQRLEAEPSWLSGLSLSPSLRYEVGGRTSSADGVYRQEGDYAITISAIYDFQERSVELNRLNQEKDILIQTIVERLNKIEGLRTQLDFAENALTREKEVHRILEQRVATGHESRKTAWESEKTLHALSLELAQFRIDLQSERYLFGMLVFDQRGELLSLLDHWEGFEE